MGNKELLLIPGPTPVVDEIYDALASETRGHTDSRFVAIYKNTLAQTKELFHSERPEEVLWEELFEDELWFVVAPEHPYANQTVSIEKMMKEPFIMREEGSSMRDHLFSLCETHQVKPPKIALQFSGINETIRSVMAGYGAIFISSLAVKEYVDNGQLARVYVQGIHSKHKVAICTRKNEKQSILVEKFIDTIKNSL